MTDIEKAVQPDSMTKKKKSQSIRLVLEGEHSIAELRAVAMEAIGELENTNQCKKYKHCSLYVTPVEKPKSDPDLQTIKIGSYSSAADEHKA